jgi:hypothetical protein
MDMKNNVKYLYSEAHNLGTPDEYQRFYVVLRDESQRRHEVTERLYSAMREMFRPYEIESDASGGTYAETERQAQLAQAARDAEDTQEAFLAGTGRM